MKRGKVEQASDKEQERERERGGGGEKGRWRQGFDRKRERRR